MTTLRHLILCLILATLPPAPAGTAEQDAPAAAGKTMKAIRVHEFGGTEVLKYEDVAIPKPGEGEMLVRVAAAGVNPVDAAVRRGAFARPELPYTPGYDVAGTVVEVGQGVRSMPPGARIFAYMPLTRPGAYAEYAIVREDEAAIFPENVSYSDAAGVPLVALTAWQALFDHGELKEGQTVLIHAGAGGVGTMAIQLAKSRGAKVITTASEPNHEFLRKLGADEVIDYTKERFEERVKDVDLVLDSIGGDTRDRSWGMLKPGGILVSIVGQPDGEKAQQHGVKARSFLVRPHALQLSRIARLLEEGKIKTVTTQTFPLDEAAKAHEQIETRHTRGKIVLELAPRLDLSPAANGVKIAGTAIGPDGLPAAKLPVTVLQMRDGKRMTLAKGITNDWGQFLVLCPVDVAGTIQLEIGDKMKSDWTIKPMKVEKDVLNLGTVRLNRPVNRE